MQIALSEPLLRAVTQANRFLDLFGPADFFFSDVVDQAELHPVAASYEAAMRELVEAALALCRVPQGQSSGTVLPIDLKLALCEAVELSGLLMSPSFKPGRMATCAAIPIGTTVPQELEKEMEAVAVFKDQIRDRTKKFLILTVGYF